MISQLQIYPAYTQIYIGHFYKKDIDDIHCKVMHHHNVTQGMIYNNNLSFAESL